MIYSVQQIKFEMLAHIKEFGGEFGDWYFGIASDPLTELMDRHGVDREQDVWLFKQTLSFNACLTLQRFFLDRLATDGKPVSPPSGEHDQHDCVYLYRKSDRTTP